MLWTTDLLLSIYCPIMQCLQYRLSRWHLLNHDCPVRGKRIKEDSVLFSVISHIIRWKSNITNQSVRMLVCGFWWKSEWFYNTFTTWTMEYGRMYHHVNFAELHQAGGRSIITRTHFHKVTLLFLMSVTCLCLLKVLNVFNNSMNVDFVDNENKNRCFSPAGLVRAVYKHSLHWEIN